MDYINRKIAAQVKATLQRGKSVLLLGARQTGKTTLINEQIKPDLSYSFVDPDTRLRYEKDPTLLGKELALKLKDFPTPPVIFIDEIQRVPIVMDVAQLLIDQKKAQFILTGSSVRKLKHGTTMNLLPGRVVALTMDPLHFNELPQPKPELLDLLIYGTLPSIITEEDLANREIDLRSYATTYLEEEIRSEAMVRNIGHFARFLELAAGESGHVVNFTKLSQDIGVAASTIIEYYQILADCMMCFRIDPIIKGSSRRRLVKSPKHLFFDLGVRRICANEGAQLPEAYFGNLFEQYVGIELIHQTRAVPHVQVRYWRDASGAEVDFVLDVNGNYIPIEVKWSEQPSRKDARHLEKFLGEYGGAVGYIVCRTPQAFQLADNIIALPWQEIATIFKDL
jgi:predicted AAA+ superfamily ATPase